LVTIEEENSSSSAASSIRRPSRGARRKTGMDNVGFVAEESEDED